MAVSRARPAASTVLMFRMAGSRSAAGDDGASIAPAGEVSAHQGQQSFLVMHGDPLTTR